MAEAGPDLSVVCRNCGAEVSPYVTECPYCGTRLRKRAPKLERVGDEVRVREDRRTRRLRKQAERRERAAERLGERRALTSDLAMRPIITYLAVAAGVVVLLVERASSLTPVDLGAITGPVGGEFWRYFAAPFVYDDIGYLFACGLALAIFLPPIERRIGWFATFALVIGTGALGMLAAAGIESSFGDGVPIAAGGNGIALGALGAYWVLRDAEHRADPTDEYDRYALAVAAVVLLCLPLVEDFASVWAGLGGALVGAACGLAAALSGRTSAGA